MSYSRRFSHWIRAAQFVLILASTLAYAQTATVSVAGRLGIRRATQLQTGASNLRTRTAAPAGLSLNFGLIDFPRSPDSTANGLNKYNDVVGFYGPNLPQFEGTEQSYLLHGNSFWELKYPGAQCAAFVKLAEYDQKSWLAAMGDPHPLAESSASRNFLTIPIDGSMRTGCSLEAATHSDLSSAETPLAKHMGMPPEAEWKDQLSAFHDVDLHVVGAWWYDRQRDISVIVYTASSRFKNRAALVTDNAPAIATSLRQIMQQAKLVEAGGNAQ